MSQNITFNIYVMSRMRSHLTMNLTHSLLEYCTYVVREEEVDDYRAVGIKNILSIPKGEVECFMTTFYWIIKNTPEDVIAIVDDDLKGFTYRIKEYEPLINKDETPDKEKITMEIERIGQLLFDLKIGLGYDNPQSALYAYNKEFAFKGMPGHIRWINKESFKAKLNIDDPASSDIDMAMQELLMNRIVLLPKYFVSHAHMDKLEGDTEDRKAHIDLTYAMRSKWGGYFDYNYKKNRASINIQR